MFWDHLRFMSPNVPTGNGLHGPRGELFGTRHPAGTERLFPQRFVVARGNGEFFHAVSRRLEKRRIPAGELVIAGKGGFIHQVNVNCFVLLLRLLFKTIIITIILFILFFFCDLFVSLEKLGTQRIAGRRNRTVWSWGGEIEFDSDGGC